MPLLHYPHHHHPHLLVDERQPPPAGDSTFGHPPSSKLPQKSHRLDESPQ
ncbi:UNVERIFIED_CONTAM: hypothetical protein Sradi_5419300 [Sesamum radiatum]|uniref:Uncharacterized protein n=1 Tax=Sesamum radiatum TaxID=300843 RepID=A0AAW2LB59_SESRA